MESLSTKKLGELNSYQVAGLAVLASGLTTLGVVLLLRRTVFRAKRPDTHDAGQSWAAPTDGTEAAQPAVGIEMPAELPRHFTEDLIIPGYTETGQQVSEQDDREGRSPEGA